MKNRKNPKPKKPIYKRVWFWIVVVLAVAIFGNSLGSGNSNTKETASSSSVKTEKSSSTTSVEQVSSSSSEVKTSESSSPSIPIEYKNALTKAKSYSSMMHMSKTGIYDQLTSNVGEGFSAEAAQYAVDNLNADYNKNALEKAKSYQSQMAMSKDAIYDQLASDAGEKFTAEEAQYAVNNLPS